MTAYRVGDVPATSDVFEIPDSVSVTGFTAVSGTLVAPDGTTVTMTGATFALGSSSEEEDDDGEYETEPVVTVGWGTASPFQAPGLHRLDLLLTGSGGVRRAVPGIPIVVEHEDGWLTIDSIRRTWSDAPVDDEDVFELLEVSRDAVIAFAPTLADGAPVPSHYRKGQRMQARNTWNAAKVDASSGGLGSDTFVIRPVPLDWAVKQVLRPKPAIPPVG